jgi:endonuclease/exonuclease/phosphatase family metal-dependent hydrolase
MFESFGGFLRKVQLSRKRLGKRLVSFSGVAALGVLTLSGTAAAQTTVTLNGSGTVVDATIRSGPYANTNYGGDVLITRASSEPEWLRRTLVKFDTENTIPAGSYVHSARLTLTVKSGLGSAGQTRTVSAYRVMTGWLEEDATWNTRMNSSRWSTPGGDLGAILAQAEASNAPGSKVTIDVTGMVKQAVAGQLDTRYTRIALIDSDSAAKESYREYYSSEDSSAGRRPTLVVTYGASGTPPPPPPPPPTSNTTLKVVQWNIHQGIANNGSSNIDSVVSWLADMRPDLISFNEILKYSSNNQPQILCDKLRARTGQNWTYVFEQISGANEGIGVAVLSRFPIDSTASKLLSWDRSAVLARVVVNGRVVNMISTHLDHQSSSRRLQQVKEVVAWAAGFSEQRIIAGDLNWYPGTTEILEMGKTYYDAWAVAVANNIEISYPGNPEGNTRNTRIDYVFYSKGASALTVTSAQVKDARAAGISDHRPVIATFRVN